MDFWKGTPIDGKGRKVRCRECSRRGNRRRTSSDGLPGSRENKRSRRVSEEETLEERKPHSLNKHGNVREVLQQLELKILTRVGSSSIKGRGTDDDGTVKRKNGDASVDVVFSSSSPARE